MIKLYNNSKIHSLCILPIIKKVMKDLKLTKDIIVLITRGKRGGGSYSKGCMFKDKRFGHYEWLPSQLGKIVINPCIMEDALRGARYMYETILHEFKHCFDDNIVHMKFDSMKIRHSRRVQEISARFYTNYEAKIDEELLLNLAIEIERVFEGKQS